MTARLVATAAARGPVTSARRPGARAAVARGGPRAASAVGVALLGLAGLVARAPAAHAGGLARPNGLSPRAVGMGGAFTAWADDASAVLLDPAALTTIDAQVDVGGELVLGPRSYTPTLPDGTTGPAQRTTVVAPVPAIGVVAHLASDDHASPLTLGAGLWNTFGGQVSFPVTGLPALDATSDVVLEAGVAAALRVSERLSLGATFRFGIGMFSADATMKPLDAHVSASGVGVSAALAALLRPAPGVRIGLTWRAPLRITTRGDGTLGTEASTMQETIAHDQVWPQQASLGVGWRPAPPLRLAAQLDWTAWSEVHALGIRFPSAPQLDQLEDPGWRDGWTARAGASYVVGRRVELRAGAYVDTNAVPDRTIERQYVDSTKLGLAAGASLRAGAWRIDAAVDGVLPGTRTVPDNAAATAGVAADRNVAPGAYRATLVTFELAVARRF